MAWVPFYADENDWGMILEKINSDPEIAILMSNGERKWIAKNEIAQLQDGRYYLWHIPGGGLPLLKQGKVDVLGEHLREVLKVQGLPLVDAGWIEDPWSGWEETYNTLDQTLPILGDTSNVVALGKQIQGVESSISIGLSSFGWIGNRYRVIGKADSKSTTKWWNRLRNWISKNAVAKIPRWGALDGPNPEIWVFDSAFRKIRDGTLRDSNSPH